MVAIMSLHVSYEWYVGHVTYLSHMNDPCMEEVTYSSHMNDPCMEEVTYSSHMNDPCMELREVFSIN